MSRTLCKSTLTQKELEIPTRLSVPRVVRDCGSWVNALSAAGLESSPYLRVRLSLSDKLAAKFLEVTIELLKRNSDVASTESPVWQRARCPYPRNRGGYSAFKLAVIEFLFSSHCKFPKDILGILRDELTQLKSRTPQDEAQVISGNKHRQGRSLGFRGFAFAAACNMTLSSYSVPLRKSSDSRSSAINQHSPIAKLVASRTPIATTYIDCLIEYEYLSASTSEKHRHDPNGCDLIVCSEHNFA